MKQVLSKRVIHQKRINDMKTLELVMTIALASSLLTCKKTDSDQPVVCQQPTTLVAQAPCESGYAEVVILKASGYSRPPDNLAQFTYQFYPQKDTLSSDLTVSSYANASNDQITVPLTKLNNATKFVVVVSMNCDGLAAHAGPTAFSFVKRTAANPACYVWGLQQR